VSRPCSVCLHPRREGAENLLRQGLSIRRSAGEIGVGAAALHRHWRRHAANRHSTSGVDCLTVRSETRIGFSS
jgi:transposase-like protein